MRKQNDSIVLRQWKNEDLQPFTEMNADKEVMEFFPKPLSPTESAEFFISIRTLIENRGWGLWAVEVDGALAGFTGLNEPKFLAPFTPCVEIGWRLRREYWGRGIAYAAARQAESFAFENLKLPELVSFTATINTRSRRLMERIGFTHDGREDFRHPSLAEESPLSRHVLYRKQNPGIGCVP